MTRRVLVAAVAVLVVAGSVWFGQAPRRSAGAYRARAEETTSTLRSQAQTVDLWVRAVDEGQVTRQAATVAVEEADSDAESTAATFAGWDPPSGTEGIGEELTGTAAELTAALGAVRVAVHRGDWATLPATATRLGPVEDRLSKLLAELQKGQR